MSESTLFVREDVATREYVTPAFTEQALQRAPAESSNRASRIGPGGVISNVTYGIHGAAWKYQLGKETLLILTLTRRCEFGSEV